MAKHVVFMRLYRRVIPSHAADALNQRGLFSCHPVEITALLFLSLSLLFAV